MCNCEFSLNTRWIYYLEEEIAGSNDKEVHYAWRFHNKREAVETLQKEASAHPDRTYRIYKCAE